MTARNTGRGTDAAGTGEPEGQLDLLHRLAMLSRLGEPGTIGDAVALIADAFGARAAVHTTEDRPLAEFEVGGAHHGVPSQPHTMPPEPIDVHRFVTSVTPMYAGGSIVGRLVVERPSTAFTSGERSLLESAAAILASSLVALPLPAADVAARTDMSALLDSIQDPVVLLNADREMRLANRAYLALLADAGLDDGPISRYTDRLLMRDYRDRPVPSVEFLPEALAGNESRMERTLRMADGRDRSFSIHSTPVAGPASEVVGVAIVWHDETERVQRERALRLLDEVRRGLSLSGDLRHAARAVCRRVISLVSWVDMAAIYSRDAEGLALLSQAGFPGRAARLLETPPAGSGHHTNVAFDQNRTTVFQVEKDEPATESARRVLAASGAATFVNVPLSGGARRFGVLTLGARLPHTLSRVEAALLGALAAQVGAELEAVQRREEAEAERLRLQTVLDQLPEGVLLFDAGGRLVMTNHRSQEILGQVVDPSTPLIGLAARYGLCRADGVPYQPAEYPLVEVFMSGKPVLGVEQLVRRADGRNLPIMANAAPVRDAAGQLAAVVFVFQDITSLREMDRLKDEFLSIAGHELRAPITSIRGLAQLLLRRPQQLAGASGLTALTAIEEQTDQMTALVDELLDVSRIRSGRLAIERRTCDLIPVLRGCVEDARLQHEGPIALVAPLELKASIDAGRMRQVFANLLGNADKYSRPTAPITVTARSEEGTAVVTVEDRGIGVPIDDLERVFERFYRAPNATEHAGGLGLGLYLCAEIVERHGGEISVQSGSGTGSVFTLRIPLEGQSADG